MIVWDQSVGIGGGYWWFLEFFKGVFFLWFLSILTKLIYISPYMLYIFGIRVTREVGW